MPRVPPDSRSMLRAGSYSAKRRRRRDCAGEAATAARQSCCLRKHRIDRLAQGGATHMHGPGATMTVAGIAPCWCLAARSERVNRNPNRVGRDLRIGGFVAHAVGLRADNHGHMAIDLRTAARHLRWSAARSFHEQVMPMPAQHTALLRPSPRRKVVVSAATIASFRLSAKRPQSITVPALCVGKLGHEITPAQIDRSKS